MKVQHGTKVHCAAKSTQDGASISFKTLEPSCRLPIKSCSGPDIRGVKQAALGSVSAANRSGLGLIDSVMGCLLVTSVLAANEEMQEYRQLLYLTER